MSSKAGPPDAGWIRVPQRPGPGARPHGTPLRHGACQAHNPQRRAAAAGRFSGLLRSAHRRQQNASSTRNPGRIRYHSDQTLLLTSRTHPPRDLDLQSLHYSPSCSYWRTLARRSLGEFADEPLDEASPPCRDQPLGRRTIGGHEIFQAWARVAEGLQREAPGDAIRDGRAGRLEQPQGVRPQVFKPAEKHLPPVRDTWT